MNPAMMPALAAILGSAVGGAATILTAWLTQRTQGRRASIENEVRKRESLYVEFITEGSRILVKGYDHQVENLESFYGLYAVLNRIRLVASDEVLAAADRAVTRIIEPYFAPNLSPDEMRQLVLTRPDDPLKEFSETCRIEIRRLQRRA
jgi:hypothetical protein